MTQDTISGPFKCGDKKTSMATDCHKLIHDTNDSGIFECIDESKFIRRIAGTLEQSGQTSFKTTEKESLSYVGYSMGTMQLIYALGMS